MSQSWAFSSKDGVEVDLQFDGRVVLPTPYLVEAEDDKPEETKLRTPQEQVEKQLKFLSGAFQFNPIKGGRRVDDSATITRQDEKYIHYHYQGKALLEKNVGSTYDFVLPFDPQNIATIAKAGAEINPCTDPHYASDADFFYFFNPTRSGCHLKNGVDYFKVAAKLTRLPESPITYPDYSRLIDKNGEITIHVLQGKNKDTSNPHPKWSFDVAAKEFRSFSSYLRKQGFSDRRLSETEIRRFLTDAGVKEGDFKKIMARYGQLPFIREYEKKEGGVKVKVRFFYGTVSADGDSAPLHAFWKDALENASVAIYNGHSGLGGNLDLKSIEKELGEFQVDGNRYQIWVLDGCSTYTYYQEPYFNLKGRDLKGVNPRNNLQILSTGLESDFRYNSLTAQPLVNAILAHLRNQAVPSWKSLIQVMSHDNLLSVAGDEMSPQTPDGRYLVRPIPLEAVRSNLNVPSAPTFILPSELAPMIVEPAPAEMESALDSGSDAQEAATPALERAPAEPAEMNPNSG